MTAPETEGDRERQKIAGRAGVVASGTLLSRVLGLARDQVIAGLFPRAITDAFFVAFTIPNVLRQLLAEGAVQNAVLPVLTQTREQQGEASARQLFRAVRGLSLTLLFAVSLLGVWAAPALVELFAAGYHEHPGQFERTVELTRWVFPYIFFMGTAALGMAALNMHQRFFTTSFAPGLLNLAFIAFALALPGPLSAAGKDPALALAFGALAGGLAQMLAQWPSLRAIGYLTPPSLEFGHPGVREMLRRMGPALFGVGVYHIDIILSRRFLSELGVGAQSYFNWAQRLCDFPQGIFVMALQTATLPSLAKLVVRGEHEELKTTFAFGMRLVLFVALPATALFVVLAEPIIVLVYQRGAFDEVSTAQTARSLVAQGLGIWTVAAVRQLVSMFYALGDTRTPVLVAVLDLAVFLACAVGFRERWGHVGVGMAVTVSSLTQMLLLWAFLRVKLRGLHTAQILRSAAKTSMAALVAALAAWQLSRLWATAQTGSAWERLLPGLFGSLGFVFIFLLGARLLRSQELAIVGRAARRFTRREAK